MIVKALQFLGQGIVYAGMALWLGYFANQPVYNQLPPDMALVKLSVIHGAQHEGACRKRTQAELNALAPNMRAPLDCPRERLPVTIEVLLDGKLVYRESVQPAGLARGGKTRAYYKFQTGAGPHELEARLVDSARTEGYDYEKAVRIDLIPGENFVIDFRAELGGFKFLGRSVTDLPEN